MTAKAVQNNLNERLINFAARVMTLCEVLPRTDSGNHLRGQLLRSGTSPAANYAEAQGAESCDDFIHKIKIAIKELRESEVWIKLIVRTKMINPESKIMPLLSECNELIAILVKSIHTARKNSEKNLNVL